MPKRANFASIQLSHHIPTKNQKPSRFRTGFETIVPYKTSNSFIGKAKHDGKIIKIDNDLELIIVEYKDKTTEVFKFGEARGESPGLSINHRLKVIPEIKVGKQVKEDEILTYHEDFFNYDPISKTVAWCHGVPAVVAISAKDTTLEDSSMISSELASKLELESIYDRPIVITSDMVISDYVKIGQVVKHNDPLLKLQYQTTADLAGEADELFEDLHTVEYRSKNNGIITDIQIFHVSEELNDSVVKFISKSTQKHRQKASLAKGSNNQQDFIVNNKVDVGTRIKGFKLGENDILIVYYIKVKVEAGVGDKVVFDSSLKSVIGRVSDHPIVTEHGETVDAVFGLNSIFNRIILSPMIQGISDRVLKHVEQDLVNDYFK